MAIRKIILLDDHTLFLKGLTMILKDSYSDVDIYTYHSIKKLKSDKLDFNEFDLLISDIELPEEDTFELFRLLRDSFPKLPILVVSMHKKIAVIKKCKLLGIEGYLLKNEDEQLNKAVETIINGEKYYSDSIVDFCNNFTTNIEKLSLREEEIIKLIATGNNNKEIADKLFVTIETIKTHKKNIKLKLELNTNLEITNYAKKNYLL